MNLHIFLLFDSASCAEKGLFVFLIGSVEKQILFCQFMAKARELQPSVQ